MGNILLWIIVSIVLIAPPVFCAKAAKDKNRSPVAWFLLGLFFNIFAWICLLFLIDEKGNFLEIKENQLYRNKNIRFLIIAFIVFLALLSYYWLSYLPKKKHEYHRARQEKIQTENKR